jgi:hypothetical protein
MHMTTQTETLLLEKFLDWQKESGGRKTVQEFAEYIGINYPQLNHFIAGRREPGIDNARLLAEFFHDQRFFDAIGAAREDPNFQFVRRNWGKAPPETQKQISQLLAPYTTDPIPNDGENETTHD